MKLLFICTGNSCRSVMGEFLLNKMARDRGLAGWEARSCGIAAERYFPTPEGVVKALAERGITDISHVPQLVGRELLSWADLILPLAKLHREFLLDEFPEFTAKIKLFTEAAGAEPRDIEDPIGMPSAVYLRCRDEIEKGLESIVERHVPKSH